MNYVQSGVRISVRFILRFVTLINVETKVNA